MGRWWAPVAGREDARAFADELTLATSRIVEVGICAHPAGPPICWCRPPLPGLWVAFATRHGVDVQATTL